MEKLALDATADGLFWKHWTGVTLTYIYFLFWTGQWLSNMEIWMEKVKQMKLKAIQPKTKNKFELSACE